MIFNLFFSMLIFGEKIYTYKDPFLKFAIELKRNYNFHSFHYHFPKLLFRGLRNNDARNANKTNLFVQSAIISGG